MGVFVCTMKEEEVKLLDFFAAHAMAALIAKCKDVDEGSIPTITGRNIAKSAYCLAEDMMHERDWEE